MLIVWPYLSYKVHTYTYTLQKKTKLHIAVLAFHLTINAVLPVQLAAPQSILCVIHVMYTARLSCYSEGKT